jgi:hypothetical protein
MLGIAKDPDKKDGKESSSLSVQPSEFTKKVL